jgi:hypothetical protein
MSLICYLLKQIAFVLNHPVTSEKDCFSLGQNRFFFPMEKRFNFSSGKIDTFRTMSTFECPRFILKIDRSGCFRALHSIYPIYSI